MKCKVYSKSDFEGLRRAGRLAAHILDYITPFVQIGVTTQELDDLCNTEILRNGGKSACIGYHGYPKYTCISLNHVVCHGIPSDRKLVDGDILNIDVTVILDGWYGDTSRMYYVGKPSKKALELIDVTYKAMMIGINTVQPGAYMGDLGHAIQSYVEGKKFSVVRDYCGHGIGNVFHEDPAVLHFGKPGTGHCMEVGNVFTVEPMINVGGYKVKVLSDGWTAISADRSLSAQFEHTVGVTEEGFEIFTLSSQAMTKPPYEY